MFILGSTELHMAFVLIMTIWASYSFVREKLSIEVTSIALLAMLLVFGQLFPLPDVNGRNQLDTMALLSGFANPALVAVMALLVMGQAIIQTGALAPITQLFMTSDNKWAWVSITAVLLFVMFVSAFMNNMPLVILAIPVMQAMAQSAKISESRILIPLSFVSILGGMITLVGSSTNMLVSTAMLEAGYGVLGFFDFTIPGLILACVGFVYVLFVVPRLLPDRSSLTQQLVGQEKEFIAEIDVPDDSKLIGMECEDGAFPKMPDVKIRLIQRAGHLILPPFEGYKIEASDILIVAATRKTLTDILSKNPGFFLSDEDRKIIEQRKTIEEKVAEEEDIPPSEEEKQAETRVLAEIMITPASRLVDMALDHVGFLRQYGAVVLGIQRRARVVRRRLGRIRLEAGDVFLISGKRSDIDAMRDSKDLIVLSGSKHELPVPKKAPIAGAIMIGVIVSAAVGVLSIPAAAFMGALLMIATDCVNIRQATRAIDRKIFLLVGAMLALGHALQVTGGAGYLANMIVSLPFADNSLAMASVLFIVVAICTNILSNNACAILFTPIALNMAINIDSDPIVFAITVLFAANCSFASPIGYKTNLLVMGPGHYRFRDFVKAGVPLVLLMWGTFIVIAKFYYNL